jgi:hypothetical protein
MLNLEASSEVKNLRFGLRFVPFGCLSILDFSGLPGLSVGLSFMQLNVDGFPLLKINIYSKQGWYLLDSGNGEILSQIIVSCNLKPISINRKACRKLVPVSLPFTVASLTTQTTTPPGLINRQSSCATPSKSQGCPP